ncbi:MAG: hypothetical protein ACFCAD_17680 [Pleurocapsa sp.]
MNFQLQELSFTLFAKDLKPAVIHPAILQYAEIIPADWTLMEKITYSDRELKLVFDNQVRAIVQPSRIFFAETIGNKKIADIQTPLIIEKFLTIFSRINYQALSIAPSGYQIFKSDVTARKYLSQNLLTNDPWQQFDGQDFNAIGLKLAYPYKSGTFYLDISQGNIEVKDISSPAVWFAGNFNYPLTGNNAPEKLENCQILFQQWEQDIQKFRGFVEQKLLASIAVPELNLFNSNSL